MYFCRSKPRNNGRIQDWRQSELPQHHRWGQGHEDYRFKDGDGRSGRRLRNPHFDNGFGARLSFYARSEQTTTNGGKGAERGSGTGTSEATAGRGSQKRRSASLRQRGGEGRRLMAFVPHEQQWLLTGPLDVVLVNHTPYEMLYTFTIKEEDKFANVDFGQVDKYEKIVIETISRDDLEYWLNGVVQAILTAETSDSVLLPLNAPFSLRPGRFYKEGSYLPSGILGEKSVMICLS